MYSSSFRLTNRDIDLAFDAKHLFLVCQPKLCLATGEVLGAEAYIRWKHPDYGLLPPGLFLSFFERRERSGELTRFVAHAAAETIAKWQRTGQHWPLSVNLGAPDLADKGLPGALDRIMDEHGLERSLLVLEVPEGAFARHGAEAQQTLAAFRRLGFSTALDGGGAVIVPDDLLTPDHFDEVKIGGAAIIQFARRLKSTGLGFVSRRVSLAASRGLRATAVGVEDRTTLTALPALGFTSAQGSHIAPPASPAELIGWSAPPLLRIVAAAEPEIEEEILLTDPLPENVFVETAETAEEELLLLPVEEYSWEAADAFIPGEEVRAVSWRLDRTCLFPDRHLLALVRRPRTLPHMKKPPEKPHTPKPARKTRPKKKTAAKPAAFSSDLVSRRNLLQIALGF
ncbi:EAL domain-containing protein [Parvibaculum sp.]|mgnify:CR=1 FL=1|jgi:EAL domain-containing protein (putative c-di-GMP-specific phosphodiesterase class I)|uniref:EAL domain-containing protein n=1 Tax=Parvibaculum sp. TaxID=2024848 RepID=UPI003C77BD6A